jgi:hypothetical protein
VVIQMEGEESQFARQPSRCVQIKNHSNICNKKNSVHRLHPPSCLCLLQEYLGKVNSLWRSNFVVVAHIDQVIHSCSAAVFTGAVEPPDFCPSVCESGQVCKSDMFLILFLFSALTHF